MASTNTSSPGPNWHPTSCTLATCPINYAYVLYDPTLGGNALYLAIFALLLPLQILLGVWYQTSGVMISICMGLCLEIIGEVGRVEMHFNPFLKEWFLLYLIPLTIGPIFIAAAIYLCLARLVVVYGEHLSAMKPRSYTLIFCCCDFISLVIVAVGGAKAALADTHVAVRRGSNIMVAGLAIQVVSLLLFMTLSLEFAYRCYRRRAELSLKHRDLYTSQRFKIFLACLTISTLTLFTRSIFRVAELSSGFGGHLANDEVSYMILEGAMVVIASVLLTVMHPGVGFGRQAVSHLT
ncbi:RTA1-domain-containing protein [Acephala macrosclerotiorum]|nr:RTA1-domain-containing protein [Acephala macrosclerotiorum]